MAQVLLPSTLSRPTPHSPGDLPGHIQILSFMRPFNDNPSDWYSKITAALLHVTGPVLLATMESLLLLGWEAPVLMEEEDWSSNPTVTVLNGCLACSRVPEIYDDSSIWRLIQFRALWLSALLQRAHHRPSMNS